MKIRSSFGFTLIEVLLVIAILAILAAVVIVAINPAKQLGEAQNAQRRSDVASILDAVHQYAVDNMGALPGNIPSGNSCSDDGREICKGGQSCDGVPLDELIEEQKYLTAIPNDPTSASDVGTGYYIYQNGSNRVGVCATNSYGGAVIDIIR